MRYSVIMFACIFNILLSSCRKFEDNFRALAVRCGVEPAAIILNTKAYQLTLENGQQLPAEIKARLQVRSLNSQGQSESLALSPKACVFMPAESRLLQAFDPESAYHLAVHNVPDSPFAIEAIRLKKIPEWDLDLVCPEDGLFARDRLPFPLFIRASGSLESLAMELKLKGVGATDVITLWNKGYGVADSDAERDLALPDLPEGHYELTLDAKSSWNGWDRKALPSRARTSCPLTIQKSPPRIDGRSQRPSTESSALLLKKGERLPWFVQSDVSHELKYCKEKIADDEDLLTEPLHAMACRPRQSCQDPANFQITGNSSADETGVFHYFLLAEDRVGNRSEQYCKAVIVADSPALLHLRWQNEEWNRPLSAMSDSQLSIEAQVDVNHPEIADWRLLEGLQCKVDFKIENQILLSGSDVLCTGVSCAGKDMGSYVACDPNIQFTLSRFWKKQKAQRLEMRLHVKASDRTGQEYEVSRSLWIYPQRFQPLRTQAADDQRAAYLVMESRDQVIFAKIGQSLQQWDEKAQNWIPSSLPAPANTKKLVLSQGAAQEIFAVWEAEESGVEAAIWKQNSWEKLSPHPLLRACLNQVRGHARSGFWCVDSQFIIHWKDGQWFELALPTPADGSASCRVLDNHRLEARILYNAPGSTFVLCLDGSLHHEDEQGQWQRLKHDLDQPESIAQDKAGRLWVRYAERHGSAQQVKIGYFEGNTWKAYSERPPSLSPRTWPVLFQASGNRVYFEDWLWDERRERWIRPDSVQRAWPDQRAGLYFDSLGRTHYKVENSFAFDKQGAIQHYPLAMFQLAADDMFPPLADSQGRYWLVAKRLDGGVPAVYRIDPVFWQSYEAEAGLTQGSRQAYISSLWLNEQQLPGFFFSEAGVIQGSDQGWQLQLSYQINPDKELKAGFSDGAGRFYPQTYSEVFHPATDGQLVSMGDFTSTGGLVIPSDGTDYLGRRWLYLSNSRDVWIVDKEQLIPARLPDSYQVKVHVDLFVMHERVLVVDGANVYRWNEDARRWDTSSPMQEALPLRPRLMTSAGSDHMISQAATTSPLQLHGPGADDVRQIPLPPVQDAKGRYLMTTHGLLYLHLNEGLFGYLGNRWVKLLDAGELTQRLGLKSTPSFQGMVLDKFDRLWIFGAPFRLLMFDLGSFILRQPAA